MADSDAANEKTSSVKLLTCVPSAAELHEVVVTFSQQHVKYQPEYNLRIQHFLVSSWPVQSEEILGRAFFLMKPADV